MVGVQFVNESNKDLFRRGDSNAIYFAELNEWQSKSSSRIFSIKSVHEGKLHYRIGNNAINVGAGEFLIAARQPEVQVTFDSPKTIRSLCIDIDPATIVQAYNFLRRTGTLELTEQQKANTELPDFFEHVYKTSHSQLGRSLNTLFFNCVFDKNELEFKLTDSWYLEFAEAIVCNEEIMRQYMGRISNQKESTRKEILKRVLAGKDYIHDNFLNSPKVKEVAEYCNMSEFHFYRSFKTVFQTTPHDLINELKLTYAHRLLATGKFSATEVSRKSAFNDIATFSRAFKKKYKVSPGSLLQNR